tara:strand:- start:275 stop:1234 length:960 start_codon:yes stop_codon:yes gene_type:complete
MNGKDEPVVSIIMPVRDAAATLEDAIDSILHQDYPSIGQIILALGPSEDNTSEIAQLCCRKDQRIVLIDNPSGLTASGLNAAAHISRGKYLVRVDSHCMLPVAYVTTAIQTILRTEAGNVGGIQRAIGNSSYQRAVAKAMTSRFGVGNSKFHLGGQEGPTDTVYLGVYEREFFNHLGGFDESLVRNQDYELNIRIRNAGKIIWFDPALVVNYLPRSSQFKLGRQYFQYGTWKRRVLLKNPRSTKFRQIVPQLTLFGLVGSFVASLLVNYWFSAVWAVYILAIIAASFKCRDLSFQERVLLTIIYPTMHMSWALGFVLGR